MRDTQKAMDESVEHLVKGQKAMAESVAHLSRKIDTLNHIFFGDDRDGGLIF